MPNKIEFDYTKENHINFVMNFTKLLYCVWGLNKSFNWKEVVAFAQNYESKSFVPNEAKLKLV